MEERQANPFVPMKNKELLQKIKKSGKKADQALKVEDIDALSGLPFMKPPAGYLSNNPISIKSSQKSR